MIIDKDTPWAEDRVLARLEVLHTAESRDQEMLPQVQELVDQAHAKFGHDSEVTLACERFLLDSASRIQNLESTLSQASELLGRCRAVLGDEHEVTRAVDALQARFLRRSGDEGAVGEYRRILEQWVATVGPSGWKSRLARVNLAVALRMTRESALVKESARLAATEWQERSDEFGRGSAEALIAMSAYVSACLDLLRMSEPVESAARLEQLATELFQSRLTLYGPRHRRTVNARVVLADVLVTSGRPNDAVWMLYSCRAEQAIVGSDIPENLFEVLANALMSTSRVKDVADAAPIARQALDLAERRYGPHAIRVRELRELVGRVERAGAQ